MTGQKNKSKPKTDNKHSLSKDAETLAQIHKLINILSQIRDAKIKEEKPTTDSDGKDIVKPKPIEPKPVEPKPVEPKPIEPKPEKESPKAFTTQLYDEIDSRLGGNNYDQFFCMLVPGLILDDRDYRYDLDKELKGPMIEANESRLANKMFDPSRIVNSDNGRNLAYQYKMALDMLTPKINKRLMLHKNKLRRLLISPYPYDFGEGIEHGYTLQEVYFRLYDEYMDEIYRWKKVITETKQALQEQYPVKADYENAYIEWYEDHAEDYLDKINEKKSKVLTVFSPNDMKILEGILDSGSGAELQEARQTLYNYRKISPNGGYIYPVSFEPKNWFDMIGTSFTSVELMDSPEKIVEKLQRLSLRRVFLYSGIYDICKTIGNDLGSKKLKSLMDSVKKSKEDVERYSQKAFAADLYPKVIIPVLEIRSKAKIQINTRLYEKLISTAIPNSQKAATNDEKAISNTVSELNGINRNIIDAHDLYLKQSHELVELLVSLVEEKDNRENKKNKYSPLINPLKTEIASLNDDIEGMQQQLCISTAIHENMDEDILSNDIISPKEPKGFTKVEFETDSDSLDSKIDYQANTSTILSGKGFLFNGNRARLYSKFDSNFSSSTLSEKCKIQISMNVAKIGITREWFNPGIFSLTGDMFRLSETLIAPDSDITDKGFDEDRFTEMRNKIFSCFPTAMVLARNMQIKFKYEKKLDEKTREMFESHAKSNGGFLIFRGRDEHGNSDIEGVHTYFTDQTVTLTFDTTQVIGYYLQATSPDKSTFLDSIGTEEDKKVYSTVADFSENYRQLIDAAMKKRMSFAEKDLKDEL